MTDGSTRSPGRRSGWRLRGHGDATYWIVAWYESAPANLEPMEFWGTWRARQFLGDLAGDFFDLNTLRRISSEVLHQYAWSPPSTPDLLDALARALADGQLKIFREPYRPTPVGLSSIDVPEELPSRLPESIAEARHDLFLERLYHDDAPLHGAKFQVELENGKSVEGTLGSDGRAELTDLTSIPVKVRFGPDARPYRRVDQTRNPDHLDQFEQADAEALVARHTGTP